MRKHRSRTRRPPLALVLGVTCWTLRRRGADILDGAAAITYGLMGTALIGCLILAGTRGQGA